IPLPLLFACFAASARFALNINNRTYVQPDSSHHRFPRRITFPPAFPCALRVRCALRVNCPPPAAFPAMAPRLSQTRPNAKTAEAAKHAKKGGKEMASTPQTLTPQVNPAQGGFAG